MESKPNSVQQFSTPLDELWYRAQNLSKEDWKTVYIAFEKNQKDNDNYQDWSFLNSFIYCVTVVSTIGYGHITPSSRTGRVATIVFAVLGIPTFLILLTDFAKLFTSAFSFLYNSTRRVWQKRKRTITTRQMKKIMEIDANTPTFRELYSLNSKDGEKGSQPSLNTATSDDLALPTSVVLAIVIIYILFGAFIFCLWEEDWDVVRSVYFIFVSISTIGFGDVVPKDMNKQPPLADDRPTQTHQPDLLVTSDQLCMIIAIMYLVMGLGLTSMCIGMVQERLLDLFDRVCNKAPVRTTEKGRMIPKPQPAAREEVL